MRRTVLHDNRSAAAAVATGLLVYLFAWSGVAWLFAQRAGRGIDLEGRGGQVLAAVSLFDAGVALIVVPLLVLECFSWSSRRPWRDRVGRGLLVVISGFLITTLALLALPWLSSRVEWVSIVGTRVLLATVCAAALGLGLLASSLFRDVHDAAAATYLLLALAIGGVVIAGPALVRISNADSAIAVLLVTNPMVAMASATSFDLLRTEALYRSSPIGQRLFEYPSWQSAAALYGLAAVCLVCATIWIRWREA